MSLEQALLAAIGAQSTAIVALWLWFKSSFTKCEARELACSLKYEALLERLAQLEGQASGRRRR